MRHDQRDDKWRRKIDDKVKASVQRDISVDGLADKPEDWVKSQGDAFQLTWLLAHADDAVIWGKRAGDGAWTTSSALDGQTLQQVRLFSSTAELLAWRDGDSHWQARLIRDGADANSIEWSASFDEYQMLVGTEARPLANGLTQWTDGAQGLEHAMPVKTVVTYKHKPDDADESEKQRPPRLIVRHYLANEALARIVASRLVGFEEVGK